MLQTATAGASLGDMHAPDPRHWILDGHEPVAVDLMTWARWLETGNRVVAVTEIGGDVRVSTVFLGLDHQFGRGPPLLFETVVFGGDHNGDQWRYSTWAQAELGHMERVESLTPEFAPRT